MFKQQLKFFFNKIVYIVCSYTVYALFYTLYRFVFLIVHSNSDVWSNKWDIFRAFLTGFQFDAKVITIFLLPFFLYAIIEKFTSKWQNFWHKIYTITNTVLFVITVLALIIDFYYYSFFQSHIDIIVFGLINDDTKEVLVSLWKDFPVIKISIMLILLCFGAYKLFSGLFKLKIAGRLRLNLLNFIPILLIFLTVYFYGMRGSFSTFPLQIDDSTISKNPFINQLTLNGIYTFECAYEQNKKNQIAGDPQEYLRSHNLNLQQLVADFLQIDVSEVDEHDPIRSHLCVTTSSNNFLKENPPHVVVIQMESMGTIYFDKHSKQINLLGKLEDVLQYCHVFKNFMPASNGTIPTLEYLITQTAVSSVAQSAFYSIFFSTATTRPFLQNNYQTTYVTGAKLGWRNINNYLPAQGFQSVEGRELILSVNPDAQSSGWGVFDEFMFDRIFDKIEKSNAPQYIFGMTTTNHTPYEIPENFKPLPITIDDTIIKIIRPTVNIKEVTEKNFQTHLYACDALGKFIEKVLKSPFAENTIIIATGDHNCRQSFNFDETQMYWAYSVPMIAYIPEKYLAQKTVNTKQWAGHSDIFPTLYELALSDTEYIKLGRDLINDETIPYAINEGYRIFSNSAAFNLNSNLFFDWKESNYLVPAHETAKTLELQKIYRSAKAARHLKVYLQYENTNNKVKEK